MIESGPDMALTQQILRYSAFYTVLRNKLSLKTWLQCKASDWLIYECLFLKHMNVNQWFTWEMWNFMQLYITGVWDISEIGQITV